MKLTAFVIFLLLGLFNSLIVFSQVQDISYYNSKSDKYWHSDLDSAYYYTEKAYQLSFNNTNWLQTCNAKANKGIAAYSQGNYEEALVYYDSAILIAENHLLPSHRFVALKVNALKNKAEYSEAIQLLNNEIQRTTLNDTARFILNKSLLSLFIELGRINESESIFSYLDQLKVDPSFISSIGYISLKAEYYNRISDFTKSDSLAKILLRHYDSTTNYLDRSSVLNLIGDNAMQVGKYDTSLKYFSRAIVLQDSVGYEFGTAKTNRFLGSLYSYLGEFEEASKLFYEALAVFERIKNLNEVQKVYYELGWIYYERGLYSKAIEYLDKATQLALKVGNNNYLGNAYNALGNVYYELKNYEEALKNYIKASEIKEQSKDIKGYSASKFNAAIVYDQLGLKNKALEIYLETYKIDQDLNNELGMAIGEYSLAKFYKEQNNLKKSVEYISLSVKRLEKLNVSYELAYAYKIASEIFAANKDFIESNKFLKAYSDLQDKNYETERNLEIDKLEARYQLKNYEQQIKLLKLEKENSFNELYIKETTIRNQRIFIYLGIVGAFILLLLLYITYRFLSIRSSANKELKSLNRELSESQEEIIAQSEELQEANDQIREMNSFLEKRVLERTNELLAAQSDLDLFFYKASHDFRGPLTTFMGIAEVAEISVKDPKSLELFQRVKLTANKLDKMVRKLQSISLLSTQEIDTVKKDEIHIPSLFEKLEKEFEGLKVEKNIKFNFSNNIDKTDFYHNHLKLILEILIENGIVFNHHPSPTISIDLKRTDQFLQISVEDNGKGIPEYQFDSIFNMFNRTSTESTGNGLGLFLLKKIVTYLKGEIKLSSELGKGSRFLIRFPS